MFFLHPSQKRLLNSLNPVFFVAFVAMVLLVRSTSAQVLPRMVLTADLLMPFMVFFAQRRSTWEDVLRKRTAPLYRTAASWVWLQRRDADVPVYDA